MSKLFKSEGIVLRSLKYSETSVILDIYTQSHGLSSFIVSGVRKAKSKMNNVFHPMNIIDLVAYLPKEETLSRIKEASYAYRYKELDQDVIKATIGTFYIDLTRQSIKEKEANAPLYDFIKGSLVDLDSLQLHPLLPLLYGIGLSTFLGIRPLDNYSEIDRYFDLESGQFISNPLQSKYVVNDILSTSLGHLLAGRSDVHVDRESRNLLLDKLIDYYRYHIEEFKELKSLPVLRAILS